MTIGFSKKIAKEKGSLALSFSDIFWTERYKASMRYQDTDFNSVFYSGSRKVYLTLTWALGRPKNRLPGEREWSSRRNKSRAKIIFFFL